MRIFKMDIYRKAFRLIHLKLSVLETEIEHAPSSSLS